jgi:hypothetical protein
MEMAAEYFNNYGKIAYRMKKWRRDLNLKASMPIHRMHE